MSHATSSTPFEGVIWVRWIHGLISVLGFNVMFIIVTHFLIQNTNQCLKVIKSFEYSVWEEVNQYVINGSSLLFILSISSFC